MALNYFYDGTQKYKQNIYSITLDMSGWDKTTIQVLAPVASAVYVYATSDGGGAQGIIQGSASLATNFTGVKAVTNLATGSDVTSITTAGEYQVNIGAQYLRLQGGGANVYGLYFNHYKGS